MLEILTKRHCCPMVVERVTRLNPQGWDLGSVPRGWNRRRNPSWFSGKIGKGHFIRQFGRAAWEAMPRCCISRHGRRQYVDREAVEDDLWKLPTDHPMRQKKRPKSKFWTM